VIKKLIDAIVGIILMSKMTVAVHLVSMFYSK